MTPFVLPLPYSSLTEMFELFSRFFIFFLSREFVFHWAKEKDNPFNQKCIACHQRADYMRLMCDLKVSCARPWLNETIGQFNLSWTREFWISRLYRGSVFPLDHLIARDFIRILKPSSFRVDRF